MPDINQIFTKFHYKSLHGAAFALFVFLLGMPLLVAAFFYSIVINLKNFLYASGILKEKKAGAKIICIGNLTTGGVGKTPVVIEFCKYLSKKYRVSSLSRGYKGKLKGANIIRGYEKVLIEDVSLAGDEVKLIAQNSTGYAVTTSSDRLLGANKAIEELNSEIIVMDDGFSNRKMAKDLSLLLFDINKFIGNGFLLPFGPLREPVYEIKRANGVILIDKENSDDSKFEEISNILKQKYNYTGQIFRAKFEPDYFYNIETNEIVNPISQSAYAFCAIGQPELFYKYLTSCCTPCNIYTKSFDDHYSYTKEDVENIIKWAKDSKYIITTEKDAVKIKPFLDNATINPDTDKQSDGKKIFLALKLKVNIDIEDILSKLNFEER